MESSPSVPSAYPPEEAPPAGALPDALVDWVVALAGQAPSVYDVRPWLIVGDGRRLELIADSARHLGVPDPDGRQQLLACGAALFHVRLALLRLGRAPIVHLLPDETRPEMIAALNFGKPGTVSMRSADWQLLEAVRHRRTRWLVPPAPPRAEGLAALDLAASQEQAHFGRVTGADPFNELDLGLEVGVVWTDSDTRQAQIAAGQAVARVLLTAVAVGVDAGLVRQPLDLPAHRELLRRRGGLSGVVQAVLRLDAAPAGAVPAPRSATDAVPQMREHLGS